VEIVQRMQSRTAYDDPASAGKQGRAAALPRTSRTSERADWVVGSALALALLAFSCVFSALAPLGVWQNQLFGGPAWGEFDPGSFYVGAAHDLARGETPRFVGHPGTPLLLLLHVIQKAYYASAAPTGLSFSEFTARHLPTVFWLSKLAMTLLHLVSLRLLFLFARGLLGNPDAALFATFGYATSLPVLYYLSRISVEPLMMICFFGAFIATWRYEELARAGQTRPALGYVALAAAAAATGAVAKLHFMGPLPFFLAVYVLLRGRRGDPRIPRRTRILASLGLLAVSGALVLGYSQWINWRAFIMIWRTIASGAALKAGTWKLAPFSPQCAFLLCELPFVALGIAGCVLFLRRNVALRSRAAWTSAYAGFALLFFAERVILERSFLPFHYFFLPLAWVAVFFGDLAQRGLARVAPSLRGTPAALAGLAFAAVVHGVALSAVVDSRRIDAARFEPDRRAWNLIAGITPGQRIAFAGGGSAPDLERLHTIPVTFMPSSRLVHEFSALFVPIDPIRLEADAQRVLVPALRAEVTVVDVDEAPGARPR
jgi:hypothetical protein